MIPAWNEAAAIGRVIDGLPPGLIRRVVVCDNGSSDGTGDVAREHGAVVVREMRRGYGAACLRALREVAADPPGAVLFLDADASDEPADAAAILAPLAAGRADLVIGSRVRGAAEPGSLTPHARFGNWIATKLLRMLYGVRWTDLGPFRAIRWDALQSLGMRDPGYGWTVEMQAKAARAGLRGEEIPVRYRRRVGTSKISGTLRGSLRAGFAILAMIGREAVMPRTRPRRGSP